MGDPTFRFGVVASRMHDARSWRALCEEVEDSAYSALYLPDTVGAQIGPVTALGAAAAHTSTLRLGIVVANNDLRAPAVFAKELATLDVLSDGRAEWGIGAGWDVTDYAAAGVPFDPPGRRVDRMMEAVDVMQAFFTGERIDHSGRHYRVSGATGTPAPRQRPHPPLLVGGAERRLLTFAGRRADIVSVNRSYSAAPLGGRPPRKTADGAVDDQIRWTQEGAADRPDRLEISMEANAPIIVTDDPQTALVRMAASAGVTPEHLAADPRIWVGSVPAIVERLREHRDRWGVSHWVVYEHFLREAEPMVAELAGT